MDIFAHGLWTAAAATGINRKAGTHIRPGVAAWWGVFPDLFAFTVPVGLVVWQRVTRSPEVLQGGRMPRLDLAWRLYHVSHSLVVFSLAFGLVWLVARRPILAMLGWPLHILIDIPLHTARFFPTPFLWPVSSFHVSGISWGNRWFMLCNYTALAIVYLVLWLRRGGRTPWSAAGPLAGPAGSGGPAAPAA
jgi:hypothetical protein